MKKLYVDDVFYSSYTTVQLYTPAMFPLGPNALQSDFRLIYSVAYPPPPQPPPPSLLEPICKYPIISPHILLFSLSFTFLSLSSHFYPKLLLLINKGTEGAWFSGSPTRSGFWKWLDCVVKLVEMDRIWFGDSESSSFIFTGDMNTPL